MEDIVPSLAEAIKAEFQSAYEKSETIQELLKAIRAGTATYSQAQKYAIEVSKLIGKAYEKHLSSAKLPDGKMYYNIASRLIPEMMDENYILVSDYAKQVQEALNKKAGLGLKAQTAPYDRDRIDGMVELATKGDQFDDVKDQLIRATETYSQSIVDSAIMANVEFQGRAGLRPVVRRRSTGRCCKWCRNLVGEYTYPVEKEIYQRHEDCKCSVTYDPGDGRRQNVYSKRWEK